MEIIYGPTMGPSYNNQGNGRVVLGPELGRDEQVTLSLVKIFDFSRHMVLNKRS